MTDVIAEPFANLPSLTAAVWAVAGNGPSTVDLIRFCERVHAVCTSVGAGRPAVLDRAGVALRERRPRAIAPAVVLYVRGLAPGELAQLAADIWDRILNPADAPLAASEAPRGAEPPKKKRRAEAAAGTTPTGTASLVAAVQAAFPAERHDAVRALLIERFAAQPALRRWRILVWSPVLRGGVGDLLTPLDVSTHPLVPALVDWCGACLAATAGPPPPPPGFDGGGVAPVLGDAAERHHYGAADPAADWAALMRSADAPAARVLREFGVDDRCVARAGVGTVPALEPARIDYLRRTDVAAKWWTFREAATILGWDEGAPAAQANQLVPLLAHAHRTMRGADGSPWRLRSDAGPRAPWRYRLSACCGDLRRAAVWVDALAATTAAAPMDRIVLSLNLHAPIGDGP